jgi:hypothetical protein
MTLVYRITICLLLCSNAGQAQELKLQSATRQRWAGGVAGHQGSRYWFKFVSKAKDDVVMLDSIYIDGGVYAIMPKGKYSGDAFVVETTTKQGVTKYTLIGGTTQTTNMRYDPQAIKTKAVTPPVHSRGIAVVRYTRANTPAYLLVRNITTELEPVNYP